jgi:cystathionine beta-lyase
MEKREPVFKGGSAVPSRRAVRGGARRHHPRALRAAGHIKWTSYGPATLGAFVAEMDLGTAPAVLAALDAAVAGELIGYLPHPIMRDMQAACATYQADASGGRCRPSRCSRCPTSSTASRS